MCPWFEDILVTPDDIEAEQVDTRGNLPVGEMDGAPQMFR